MRDTNLSKIFKLSGTEFLYELFDYIMDSGFDSSKNEEVEVVLIVALSACGVLENGGLVYFFENDFPEGFTHSKVADVFEKVGLHLVSEIITKAISFLPENTFTQPEAKRASIIERFIAEENNPEILQMEAGMLTELERFNKKLEVYVRQNWVTT